MKASAQPYCQFVIRDVWNFKVRQPGASGALGAVCRKLGVSAKHESKQVGHLGETRVVRLGEKCAVDDLVEWRLLLALLVIGFGPR